MRWSNATNDCTRPRGRFSRVGVFHEIAKQKTKKWDKTIVIKHTEIKVSGCGIDRIRKDSENVTNCTLQNAAMLVFVNRNSP